MKIEYKKDRNAWFVAEKNTYFHMPFLLNSSNAFLKRIFRQEMGVLIDGSLISALRNPGDRNHIILSSSTSKKKR